MLLHNNYEVLSHLGSGTFGRVYKCKHIKSGILVAVKELPRDKFRELVIANEVDILRKLTRHGVHENHFIMKTLDIIEEPSRICLVLELLDRSLYHLMKDRKFCPLPLHDIRIIAYQLFSALQRLLELSLLHTDIKPENIMLVNHARWPYRVKLIDFGSASRESTARIYRSPYIQSRFYRSPEILVGSTFNEAIDMWSVGCVLAEISTGLPLYPGSTEYDQVRYIADVQGNFPDSILYKGQKSPNYFVRIHHQQCKFNFSCCSKDMYTSQQCQCPWRLKTPFEYEIGSGSESKETRKLRFSNLSQLIQSRRCRENLQNPSYDESIEQCDSAVFTHLLKLTLCLDPNERIKPAIALHHDFVTGEHLKSYDARSLYISRTNESSYKAFAFYIIPNCNSINHQCNFSVSSSVAPSCGWNDKNFYETPFSSYEYQRCLAQVNLMNHNSYVQHGNDMVNVTGKPVPYAAPLLMSNVDKSQPLEAWLHLADDRQTRLNEINLPSYFVNHHHLHNSSLVNNSVYNLPTVRAGICENSHLEQPAKYTHFGSSVIEQSHCAGNNTVYFPSSEVHNVNHQIDVEHNYSWRNEERFHPSRQPLETYDSAILYSSPRKPVNHIHRSFVQGDASMLNLVYNPPCGMPAYIANSSTAALEQQMIKKRANCGAQINLPAGLHNELFQPTMNYAPGESYQSINSHSETQPINLKSVPCSFDIQAPKHEILQQSQDYLADASATRGKNCVSKSSNYLFHDSGSVKKTRSY